MGSFSNYLQVSQIHPVVVDWTKRVVKNGGALPGQRTVQSLSNFWASLVKNRIDTKMKSVNCFVPDNLIAAVTPLYKTFGNDPWTNNNFISSDLTINGLKGNGSSKYLDTGVVPSTVWTGTDTGSVGLTSYISEGNNNVECDIGSYGVGGAAPTLTHYISYAGTDYFDCWEYNTGRVSQANANWSGYSSGNRTARNSSRIDIAKSTVAWNILNSITTSTNNSPPGDSICIFTFGGLLSQYSSKRHSFDAIHNGLTTGESLIFYNLIQTMRQQIGGGYV